MSLHSFCEKRKLRAVKTGAARRRVLRALQDRARCALRVLRSGSARAEPSLLCAAESKREMCSPRPRPDPERTGSEDFMNRKWILPDRKHAL